MTVYDTNLLIKQISQGENVITDDFVILDLNLFEWLKGKDKQQREVEFSKLDNYVQLKNAEYSFKGILKKQESILNNFQIPFSYRFRIAEKVSKKVFAELIDFCVSVLFILITIVAICENKTIIRGDEIIVNNDADYEVSLINRSLESGLSRLSSKKMARDCFLLSKKELDEVMVKLFNGVVDVFNKRAKVVGMKTIQSKHLNYFNLTSANISKDEVDRYVDVLVNSRTNNEDTKQFFKILVNSVLIDKKRFEFNHIADLYIQYAAKQLGYNYLSKEKASVVWMDN